MFFRWIVKLGLLIGLAWVAPISGHPEDLSGASVSETVDVCDVHDLRTRKVDADRIRALWQDKIEKIVQFILEKRPTYRMPVGQPVDLFQEEIVFPDWRPVANEIYRLLANHEFMAEFTRRWLSETVDEALKVGATDGIESRLPIDVGFRLLNQRARAMGWPDIVWFNGTRESHFLEVLAEGMLFRDAVFGDQRHGIYGHVLQILAVAPTVDAKFGAGTMRRFLKYVGRTRNGIDIWNMMFDLGPLHYHNFHSPAGFVDFGIITAFYGYSRAHIRPNDPRWQRR